MIARAKAKYIRISPRKFRQVIPLIKHMPVEDAIAMLHGIRRKASVYAIDLLLSALQNAKRLHEEVEPGSLYVSRLTADCGPTLKRFRAATMGRAVMIRKRTSHLTVELDEIKRSPEAPGELTEKKQPEHGIAHGAKRESKSVQKKKKSAPTKAISAAAKR